MSSTSPSSQTAKTIANQTRIVFMGTPEFAVPSLDRLINAGADHNWQVVAVYTQPDRRAGRGKKMVASPVKVVAEAHGIPVIQPEQLRKTPEAIEELDALAPDLVVVAAYGMILPTEALEIPNFGCINVHASLLPAYRGASPINAAILDGLEETGNSIMIMDKGLDTGPVLAQGSVPIHPAETAVELTERLSQSGADLLVETLPTWLVGEIAPTPQDELAGEPSVCRIIKKSAGKIDWNLPAAQIERMTRAYHPWPSAFTHWQDSPLKIISASAIDGTSEVGVVTRTAAGVAVGCGQGLLVLEEIQPAGKRPMSVDSFLNGSPDFLNTTLS